MSTEGISLKTLTTELAAKRAEAQRIADTWQVDEKNRFTISTAQNDAYRKAIREAQEIKGLIDSRRQADEIDAYLDAPETPSAAGRYYGGSDNGMEAKSLGDLFVESPEYKRAAANGFTDRPYIRTELEGKSIFSLSAGTQTINAFGSAQDIGLVEYQRRKTHIRDLFPKATTKASILYGIRETGWTNNAAQVKERYAADGVSPATGGPTDVFGKAQESDITFEPMMYPVVEIATILRVHKNTLADEPMLKSFLSGRLTEALKFREDVDLLSGTGGSQALTGLFNTPGVQTYTGSNQDGYSVQVRRAITRSLLAEFEPTGLVVAPDMWEKVELETDDTGAFRVAMSVAVGAEKKVWRIPVVETTAMPSGKYLLGAFGMGAQIYDRQNTTVTVSSEDQDNFQRGAVSIRAESRVGFTVDRPESFVIGSWTTPA
ncbi:phage major capsid protein [Actinacidiphila sp. bgisy160]|uniref:phage major capsid protein n=1 Tax=Actinacidiphila sp. bgisy160 TaxID=3413796 RepID=UPI003D73D050